MEIDPTSKSRDKNLNKEGEWAPSVPLPYPRHIVTSGLLGSVFASIFLVAACFDLTQSIYTPLVFLLMTYEGGDQRHQNNNTIVYRWRKIGGGTSAQIYSSGLFSFTNTSMSLSTKR
jgi:hypothetical protein